MDQQHAQVHVALFANGPQPAAQRAGVLFGRQSQKACDMPPRAESPNIADHGDERRGGEEAHAWDRLQERDIRELLGQRREPAFDVAHIRLEYTDLVTRARQRGAHEFRYRGRLAE